MVLQGQKTHERWYFRVWRLLHDEKQRRVTGRKTKPINRNTVLTCKRCEMWKLQALQAVSFCCLNWYSAAGLTHTHTQWFNVSVNNAWNGYFKSNSFALI